MVLELENYIIRTDDEYNFKLSEIKLKTKGGFGKELVEGETIEKILGYFGTLDQALMKLLNNELLNNSDDKVVAEDIIELITSVKAMLESTCHVRPREI